MASSASGVLECWPLFGLGAWRLPCDLPLPRTLCVAGILLHMAACCVHGILRLEKERVGVAESLADRERRKVSADQRVLQFESQVERDKRPGGDAKRLKDMTARLAAARSELGTIAAEMEVSYLLFGPSTWCLLLPLVTCPGTVLRKRIAL